MRLWTNGATHVVLGPDGLVVHRDGAAQRAVGLSALGDGFSKGALAVSLSGNDVWLSNARGSRHAESNATRQADDPARLAMLPISPTRSLVALQDATAPLRASLALAGPNGQSSGPSHALAIEASKAIRVRWPIDVRTGGVWGAPAWNSDTDLSLVWEMSLTRYGAAAVDQRTGIVVVIRTGSDAASFVLRVPVQYPDIEIQAAATEQGVLVAHRGARRTGGLNHFGTAGEHLTGRRVTGLSSGVTVLDPQHAMLATEETENYTSRVQVWFLDPLTLEPRELIDTDLLVKNEQPPAIHAALDGSAFIVGDGTNVLLGRREGRSNWSIEPLK